MFPLTVQMNAKSNNLLRVEKTQRQRSMLLWDLNHYLNHRVERGVIIVPNFIPLVFFFRLTSTVF